MRILLVALLVSTSPLFQVAEGRSSNVGNRKSQNERNLRPKHRVTSTHKAARVSSRPKAKKLSEKEKLARFTRGLYSKIEATRMQKNSFSDPTLSGVQLTKAQLLVLNYHSLRKKPKTKQKLTQFHGEVLDYLGIKRNQKKDSALFNQDRKPKIIFLDTKTLKQLKAIASEAKAIVAIEKAGLEGINPGALDSRVLERALFYHNLATLTEDIIERHSPSKKN